MSHVAKRLAAIPRSLRAKNEFLSIEMSFNVSASECSHIFGVNFTIHFSFFGTILRMRTNRRKEKAGSCFAFNARTSTWKLGVCSKQIRWLWAGAKKKRVAKNKGRDLRCSKQELQPPR